jgi:hypothetical protein
VTEDRSSKAGDYPAPEGDTELGCPGEISFGLFGHRPKDELMAEFVDRKLADRVWDLSVVT